MDVIDINESKIIHILNLSEDHFNDLKSKRIAPAKLQETFVAFANSDGGEIYLGVEDKKVSGDRVDGFHEPEEANAFVAVLLEQTKPAVENVVIEFLRTPKGCLILHLIIPKSPKVHYTASDDCYIRKNAQKIKIKGERVTSLGYSKGAEPYEKKAIDNVEIEDILESKYFLDYIKRVGSEQEPIKFLRKQGLLTKNSGSFTPNVASVLLFDEDSQSSLGTRSAIKVYRLRTTDEEYNRDHLVEMPKTIHGPIENQITGVIKQVKEYVDGVSYREGDHLIKMYYPAEALKEVLVNAVIHRDYSLNDDIHVRIYDNRIEISSPGRLPGPMTIQNIYDERFSRNPTIVRMLHNLPNPLNHDIGEGLNTAKNELRKVGLVPPFFSEKESSFIVTIKHQRIASIEDIILNYFKENPSGSLTNKVIREMSGETDMQKVKVALQKLRATGDIKVKDPKANAFHYSYVKS